ncbi:MAG: hypothetical protein JWM59_5047 [Verrucomicrobiales bacterium]|nr:hypothetical protein [Verrucomicrobiales bacterium]
MLSNYAIFTCGVSSRRPLPEIGFPSLSTLARRARVAARLGKRIPVGLTTGVGLVRTRPDGGFKWIGHRLNPEAPSSGAGLTGDAHVTGDIHVFYGIPAVGVTPVSPGEWRGGHPGVTPASPGEWRPCRLNPPLGNRPQGDGLPGAGRHLRGEGLSLRLTVPAPPPSALRLPDHSSPLLHAHEHHHPRLRRLHLQRNSGAL